MKSIEIRNSITAESSSHWGEERIVIDMLQNHLPADSGGTDFSLEYLIDGQWIRHEQANGEIMNATIVRVTDDGRGYDYRMLGVEYSDKPRNGAEEFDGMAAGKFGEGLKRLCAATLGNGGGAKIVLRSIDWVAIPRLEKVTVDERRGKTANQLVFDVSFDDAEMDGSSTIIHNPTQEMLRTLSRAGARVLAIKKKRSSAETIFRSNKHGEILHTPAGEPNAVFVKGLHVTDDYSKSLLFSYNLDIELNRDRDHVKEWELNNAIRKVLMELDDTDIMTYMLQRLEKKDGNEENFIEGRAIFWEHSGPGSACGSASTKYRNRWRQAFERIHGTDAVICEYEEEARIARLSGYTAVRFPDAVCSFLKDCGVKTAEQLHKDIDQFLLTDEEPTEELRGKNVETIIGLSYRARKWDIRRSLLDVWSNHVPSDSGGTKVDLEVLVTPDDRYSSVWMPYAKLKDNMRVYGIRFADDGRGFSNQHLRLLLESKPDESTVGKYGEGLKLLCSSALRNGKMKVKVRSKDWAAAPVELNEEIANEDGVEAVSMLSFRVLEGLSDANGSSTQIMCDEHSQDFDFAVKQLRNSVLLLMPEFRDAGYSIAFDKFLFRVKRRDAPTAAIFNKGVLLTGCTSKMLFSYNLTLSDLSPDRDYGNIEEAKEQIAEVLSKETRKKVIQRILKAANESPAADYMEFMDIELEPEAQEAWKEAFHDPELFGARAVISTSPLASMNAVHVGYEPILLNKAISLTLQKAGVRTDAEVAHECLLEFDEVRPESLTAEEREVLDSYPLIEAMLNLPHAENVRIITAAYNQWGEEIEAPAFHTGGNTYIRREILGYLPGFARVFLHEKGHEVTGHSDPEDGFRAFFECFLTGFVVKELGEMKSGEPQASVSVNFVPALEAEAHKLRAEVGSLRAQLSTLKEEAERLRKNQREEISADDGFVVPEKVEETRNESGEWTTLEGHPMPEPPVWHDPIPMAANRAEFKESDQPDSDMCLELHVRVSGLLRDKHVTIKIYGRNEENIAWRLENLATRRRGIEEWCRINLIGRQVHSEMQVEIETKCGNRRQSFDTHMINARPKLRELYSTLRKKGYIIGKMVEGAKQKKASQLS